MNERFTLDSTVTEIAENERVNKKLPIFFDLALCSQVKWPFSKMKLKNMMKMTKFPGQELVDAANFILERREAGDKITIPIWRGLPGNEAEAAEHVVLIPFISDEENRPAILICPDWENGRQRVMDEGMNMAKTISELGCQAFILNLRKESEAGKNIIIIGNGNHPEVEGIKGWCSTEAYVLESEKEAENFSYNGEKKLCVVSQTTFNYNKFNNLVEILEKKGYDIHV